ncbi:MAG: ATP-dependent acyl-CoA ligase, partial [Lysobacteraceae bacterium]
MSDFGMATVFSVNDPQDKLGSAGRVRTFYEMKIVDDDDFEVAPGETGEIAFRCNEPWRAPSGYYKMPEATANARRNLWFHTGDRGYVDADGYLFFVDRKKDAIRRRGENISAFEVEQIICLHPAVAEAAVYPVRADTAEDEVAASVQLREGAQADEKDLVAFCADNMAYYMVPRFLDMRPDFPRTLSQKIQKHLLKDEIEGRLASVWDRERAGIVVRR